MIPFIQKLLRQKFHVFQKWLAIVFSPAITLRAHVYSLKQYHLLFSYLTPFNVIVWYRCFSVFFFKRAVASPYRSFACLKTPHGVTNLIVWYEDNENERIREKLSIEHFFGLRAYSFSAAISLKYSQRPKSHSILEKVTTFGPGRPISRRWNSNACKQIELSNTAHVKRVQIHFMVKRYIFLTMTSGYWNFLRICICFCERRQLVKSLKFVQAEMTSKITV